MSSDAEIVLGAIGLSYAVIATFLRAFSARIGRVEERLTKRIEKLEGQCRS